MNTPKDTLSETTKRYFKGKNIKYLVECHKYLSQLIQETKEENIKRLEKEIEDLKKI